LILASVRSVSCKYLAPSGVIVGSFTGSLSNIGLDLGVAGGRTIVWKVSGIAAVASVDGLNGEYAGSQGVHLMRHSTSQLRLELVSLTEETGLGFSTGWLGLQLSASNQ
jgi:hypothetical protein